MKPVGAFLESAKKFEIGNHAMEPVFRRSNSTKPSRSPPRIRSATTTASDLG